MIIFGTRGVKSTKSEGDFSCPQCASTQHYKHKKVTNFFTLYFIPLIPLGNAGEYVECQSCRGTFVPRVLDYSPGQSEDEFQSIYEKAMRHIMILMMLADGEIDENEMIAVQGIINKFGHNDVTLDELDELVREVEHKQEPMHKYLSKVAPSLNEHGKEIIIKCALAVAAADGHIDLTEMELIREIASTMEMSPAHLKGILSDMNKDEPKFSNN